MTKPRILIADDHEIFCAGLRTILAAGYDVVGSTGDGDQVLQAVESHKPDLLVLDLSLPGRNGLDLIAPLVRQFPSLRIVVVTRFAARLLAERALQLGASAFVPKNAPLQDVHRAIRAALAGEQFVPDSVLEHEDPAATAALSLNRLTAQEHAVVALIARGSTNAGIVSVMAVSVRTIHFHRTNIRRKLGIHEDVDLLRFAVLATAAEGVLDWLL